MLVTRLLDTESVESSIPTEWIKVERQLYPKSTAIWLLKYVRFQDAGDSPLSAFQIRGELSLRASQLVVVMRLNCNRAD